MYFQQPYNIGGANTGVHTVVLVIHCIFVFCIAPIITTGYGENENRTTNIQIKI